MERKTDKIEASLKKQTSDYQATKRKIVDGKVQYVNDGSRVTSRIGDDPAGSKVGKIKPEEIYGKAPISLTKEQLRDPERNPYNNGTISWNKEKHILTDLDEKVVDKEKGRVFKNGKWRPINSKYSEGDRIMFTEEGHSHWGLEGMIKNIRSYNDPYVMAVIVEDRRARIPGEKVVCTSDQVELVSAVHSMKDDYLFTNVSRNDIVAGDND